MAEFFCKDSRYCTTKRVFEVPDTKPEIEGQLNSFSILKQHAHNFEGGLRLKGFTKRSFSELPLITIITVVFRGKEQLQNTILSILCQTYENVEYIIIDGGSNDGTLDVISKFDDLIDYWVSEPDKGIYDAMNKGLRNATGDWVLFMNCGDSFYDSAILKNLLPYFRRNIVGIYGRSAFHFEDMVIYQNCGKIKDLKKGMQFSHQSFFVRRFYLENRPFNLEYRFSADFDFIYWLASNYELQEVDFIVASLAPFETTEKHILSSTLERWRIVGYRNAITNVYYLLLLIRVSVLSIVKCLLGRKLTQRFRYQKQAIIRRISNVFRPPTILLFLYVDFFFCPLFTH